MSPGTICALDFVVTFGVPIWLCLRPMGPSGGDSDRRREKAPAPLPPTAPAPIAPALRPLPDCLIPQPAPSVAVRDLEPV